MSFFSEKCVRHVLAYNKRSLFLELQRCMRMLKVLVCLSHIFAHNARTHT